MKTISRAFVLGAVMAIVAPLGHAAMSANDAAAVCKAEAQARYAAEGETVRVKFKGMYGGSANRKVRMQVLPAEGKAFLAICDLNAKTGEVLALSPQSAPGRALASTAR